MHGIEKEEAPDNMLFTTITKQFKFEAAHRLQLGYVGPCSDMHGHSYRADITVECPSLDKYSMVMDFSELKGSVGVNIKKWLDHKTILHVDDPMVDILRGDQGNISVFTVDRNPTCEVIAGVIFLWTVEALYDLYPEGLTFGRPQVSEVTVFETETGSATVTSYE